jgi:hypothetical protein
MDASKNLSVNEFENGKYIIAKIPCDSVYENFFDTLAVDQKFRQAFRIILYVFFLFVGIIVGSVFHDRLLNRNSSQTVWKSSNLVQSDGK